MVLIMNCSHFGKIRSKMVTKYFKKTVEALKWREGYGMRASLLETVWEKLFSLEMNSEPLVWEHQSPKCFGGEPPILWSDLSPRLRSNSDQTRLLGRPQPQMYPPVALNQYTWVNRTHKHFYICFKENFESFSYVENVNIFGYLGVWGGGGSFNNQTGPSWFTYLSSLLY